MDCAFGRAQLFYSSSGIAACFPGLVAEAGELCLDIAELFAVEAISRCALDIQEFACLWRFIVSKDRRIFFLQCFPGKTVLAIAKARTADQASREHSNPTHQTYCDCTRAREAVRSHCQ